MDASVVTARSCLFSFVFASDLLDTLYATAVGRGVLSCELSVFKSRKLPSTSKPLTLCSLCMRLFQSEHCL